MFYYTKVLLLAFACFGFVSAYYGRSFLPRLRPKFETCGARLGITDVIIPDVRRLLTLDKFERSVVGFDLTQVYFALPEPPVYIPDNAFVSTITLMPGSSYKLDSKGETVADVPECVTREYILTTLPPHNRAFFNRENLSNGRNSTLVMWSSCPSKYVIFLRCTASDARRRCPLESTRLSFQIHADTLDDLLWSSMTKDLCSATGITFGTKDFKWFFNYGINELCPPSLSR